MWQLFAAVFPLAIGAALTPTLFGLQMIVVSGPQRRARTFAVMLGAAGAFAAIFALALLGLNRLPDANTGSTGPVESGVQLLAGAVLVLLSGWLLVKQPRLSGKAGQRLRGYSEHASPLVFAALAAYMSLTDVSSIVILLPALHLVTVSTEPLWADAFVIAFLYVCVLLPVWLPPLVLQVGGERAARMLSRMHEGLARNEGRVMAALMACIGVFLVYRGAVALM